MSIGVQVVVSRRKAWKAAYKAETGNSELRAAAGKVCHTALAAVLSYWRCQVADIAKEEKDAADAKNNQAAGMEADALAVVTAKTAKVEEAEDMIAQAKAANDPDAEATAERCEHGKESGPHCAAQGGSSSNFGSRSCKVGVRSCTDLCRSHQGLNEANSGTGGETEQRESVCRAAES